MHRRRRGEGAVYRRKDGRWEARLRLPDGRRTSIYTSTRRRAVAKLADAGESTTAYLCMRPSELLPII